MHIARPSVDSEGLRWVAPGDMDSIAAEAADSHAFIREHTPGTLPSRRAAAPGSPNAELIMLLDDRESGRIEESEFTRRRDAIRDSYDIDALLARLAGEVEDVPGPVTYQRGERYEFPI